MILRDIALIETTGMQVGQVNGLSVMALGGYAFGRPTRITAACARRRPHHRYRARGANSAGRCIPKAC